jgi:uncharacterized paraquat-inducible protein A
VTGRVLIGLNLSLLALFPVSWAAPLARAGFLPFFSGSEISILSGLSDLWASDTFLFIVVALFAMVMPYVKTLLLAALHFNMLKARAYPVLEVLGKLSMADVFLIALYVVIIKGVGVGRVDTAWGLYLFTALVLLSMWITHMSKGRA